MQPNTPPPDDLGIDDVAARLGKSRAWLKWRLSIDRGEPEPRLQHHHYFGRTPKWTESEYQQLRQALMTRTPPKGGRQRQPSTTAALADSPSLPETDIGTLSAVFGPKERASAFERVQAWSRSPARATPPKNSGAKRKSKSSTPSSGASILRYRSKSRPTNT